MWKINRLTSLNCITHVTTILGPCKNNAFFFWRTNFKFALFFCVCTCYVAHICCTCLLIVVGKCKLHTVLSKIINKSDWYWQKWLCNWITQLVRLQGFQGMLVTGVRFRFSKFPPSNMQSRCKAQLSTMEFFSTGERGLNMLEGFAQMMRGFGIFPVDRQKIPKMIKVAEIVEKLKIFFGYHTSLISANHQQPR